jgi:hypothetical protein
MAFAKPRSCLCPVLLPHGDERIFARLEPSAAPVAILRDGAFAPPQG